MLTKDTPGGHVMDDGELSIDPSVDVENLSPLDRIIWSEKMKGTSHLEISLKLFLYEDVIRRHLQSISRRLRHVPSSNVKAGTGNDREAERQDCGAVA
jgi:hypothetical protein